MEYEHNFRIGDRVVAVESVDGMAELTGKAGRVIWLLGSTVVSVEFDNPFRRGHSENGRGKDGHCRHGHWTSFEFETDLSDVKVDITFDSLFE